MKKIYKYGLLLLLTTSIVMAASLSTTEAKYTINETVSVNINADLSGNYDWVGIYPKNSNNRWNNVIAWSWVANNGILAIDTVKKDMPTGEYEVRLFYNNSYALKAKAGFSVNSTITIKPSQVNMIQEVIDNAQNDIHIILEEGVYTLNERIFLENKSSITITGVPYKTIIDGINIVNTEIDQESNKPTTWGGLIDIEKSEDIEIRGLYIRNSNFAGIFVHNASNDITIADNYTENTYTSGIGVWESKNIFIYGNEITEACNGGAQESITISDSSEVEVIGNEVHHNGYTELDGNHFGGEGIDIKEGSFEVSVINNYVHDIHDRVGIYIDAWDKDSREITISNNRVINNGHSGIVVASECGGNIDNIVISHNEVINNAYSGIHIAGYNNPDECPNATSFMSNFYLENNTIRGNGHRILADNEEGGAFNISNPNIYNIHIAYNTFSNNVTKYTTALAYNGISKVDSQISTWGVDSQIEPSDELKFYIYDNDATN